jgi:hypothetical protein
MVSIEKLKQFGFIDVSSDKNGLAYRKELPDGLLEMCFYLQDKHIRLQTIRSGFTHSVIGIENEYHLRSFWLLMTGSDLA